jgi:hypothetical protein
MSSNVTMTGNKTLREGLRLLRERLPPGWSLAAGSADTELRIVAPDRKAAHLRVVIKSGLTPRAAVQYLEGRVESVGNELLIAPYLTPGVRELLRAAGVSFLDLTGNVFLVVSRPGLFLEAQGADANPAPAADADRSLRGATAGRIVRALLDMREPPGVRELALRVGANPGYVSRMLAWMDREALIERRGRGQLVSVDWQRLLRRWAEEAPLASRGAQTPCLAPRGLTELTASLRRYRGRYALTGSLAVASLAPVAPTKLAVIYLDQPEVVLDKLGLRPAESGANVLLIEPSDEGVYSGLRRVDGLACVAPSQAAADLLTSPGRGPAEGEALIAWMARNEGAWRG